MQGGKVSAKDLAKVVWRLRAIPAQAVEDFRCHRRHREMPTSVLRRFIEQQRLLWSNRIGGVDYYNLGLSDPRLPMEMKRSYIGRFQSWRVFCAFNPADRKSTRLNSVTNAHLVCRLLLEKKNIKK